MLRCLEMGEYCGTEQAMWGRQLLSELDTMLRVLYGIETVNHAHDT